MLNPSFQDCHQLLNLALPAVHASSPAEFSEGLQAGFLGVCNWLEADGQERQKRLRLLQQCFSNTGVSLKQSRLLQLCSWPIFDKQILPLQAGQMPEFLWLFVLPLTVQVALEHDARVPVQLTLSAQQRQALAHLLLSHQVLNEHAQVTVHEVGLTREDLQAAGPLAVAQEVTKDCLGLAHELGAMARPVTLDPDIESGRSFTWYVLCSARMPVGQRRLMQRTAAFECERAQGVFAQALATAQVRIQTLCAHRPTALAETLLSSAACGRAELAMTLTSAREHYGVRQIRLRLPMEGMAELCGQHPSEPEAEYLLRLPFLVLEPVQALEHLLEELCEEAHLEFSGVYSVATPPSSALQ